MHRYIAILRGINVGGNRKILMADLKDLFVKQGFEMVKTYIQSGNVVFDSKTNISKQDWALKLEKAILAEFGFDVPVIIKSAKDLNEAIESNPFYTEHTTDIERLHITFLESAPKPEYLISIRKFDAGNDQFEVVNDQVFICCSGKYSASKLTNTFFESKLKLKATTRNWNTVLKLHELCSVK